MLYIILFLYVLPLILCVVIDIFTCDPPYKISDFIIAALPVINILAIFYAFYLVVVYHYDVYKFNKQNKYK